MKLRPTLTPQQISNHMDKRVWEHPWNSHMKKFDAEKEIESKLIKPNPPTKQAIDKARFVDKTFAWRNDARIRS